MTRDLLGNRPQLGACTSFHVGPEFVVPDQPSEEDSHMPSDPTEYQRSVPPPPPPPPPPQWSSAEPTSASSLRGAATDRATVRARERDAFGGMKFGSAFFGWLTSIGAIVLLIAIVSAIAALLGITNVSAKDLRGVGIGVAATLLVILFIAYFIGGYVAGRMARFNGLRQGVAVWLWAVLFAVILTVVGFIAEGQNDIGSQVNLPAIPVSSDDLTTGGLIGLAIVLVVTLIAAMLGGLAGMRFHRRVDEAGFDISDAEKDAERDETRRAEATDVRPDSGQHEHPHGHEHGAGSRTQAPRTDEQVPRQQGLDGPRTDEQFPRQPGSDGPRTVEQFPRQPGSDGPRTGEQFPRQPG